MCDPRLVTETRKRIKNHDYDALFSGGCCIHFALRLHERRGFTIRGIREGHDRSRLSHVWCERDEKTAIDIRGIYSEKFLAMLANAGSPVTVDDVSAEDLRDLIRRKEIPPDLEAEIFQLADRIVDTHERFKGAKPVDNQ